MVIQISWAFILESEKLPVVSARGNTANTRYESPFSVLSLHNTGLAINQYIGARYFHVFITPFASGCCKTIFILLTSKLAWCSTYFSLATQAVLRKVKSDTIWKMIMEEKSVHTNTAWWLVGRLSFWICFRPGLSFTVWVWAEKAFSKQLLTIASVSSLQTWD